MGQEDRTLHLPEPFRADEHTAEFLADAKRNLKDAQGTLADRSLALARLSELLEPYPTTKIPFMATDGIHLLYNPVAIGFSTERPEELATRFRSNFPEGHAAAGIRSGSAPTMKARALQLQLNIVYASLIARVLLKHPLRQQDRDAETFNTASAISAWSEISNAGITSGVLPDWDGPDLYSRSIRNIARRNHPSVESLGTMNLERIYTRIKETNTEEEKRPQPKGEPGTPGNSDGDSGAKPAPGQEDVEQDQEIISTPDNLKAEAEGLCQLAASQAQKESRSCGKMDAMAEMAMVPEYTKSKSSSMIRQLLADLSRTDYSWKRPSRRHNPDVCYLPTHLTRNDGHIAFAHDTSGSVSSAKSQFLVNEIYGTIQEVGARTSLCAFNTQIKRINGKPFIELSSGESFPTNLIFESGGGTSYLMVHRWADEGIQQPVSALIITTDGECDTPLWRHDFPTIYLVPESDCNQLLLRYGVAWPNYFAFGRQNHLQSILYGGNTQVKGTGRPGPEAISKTIKSIRTALANYNSIVIALQEDEFTNAF